ncbi:hypothetical protein NHX12_001555 [Muraenolepis orangiensis]|uniref:Suppressor of tumorigenicity 14 protein homolog n=1 Tax=Muraenolepis orangiensis TaxID=630683 RepID=A0A9Q0E0N7_9TELE|nr:hypothetical protein NHX12_001555 [Muraenolepis orangiensis]
MKLDLMKLDLMKIDLMKLDLMKIDLMKLDLMKIDLMKLDLMKIDLMKLDLMKIDLMKLDLMKIDLMKIDLMKLDLMKIDLMKIDLMKIDLMKLDLMKIDLMKIDLMKIDLMKLDLMKIDLMKIDLMKLDLMKIDLMKIDLMKIDLMKLDLMKINLMKLDLMKIDLMKIDLMKLDLMKIDLMKIDLMKWRNIGVWTMNSARYEYGNNHHERVDFLSNREKVKEKEGGEMGGTVSQQRAEASRVFSGHMKLMGVPYKQQLEDAKTKEFGDLADQLQNILETSYKKDPFLSQYYTKSVVTAFSEGVVAYYWTQFNIPPEDLEVLPEFAEDFIQDTLWTEVQQYGRQSRKNILITEVTASITDPRLVRNPRAKECFFRLEAETRVQTFESPGYPNKYPAKSRCQWQIRAPEKMAISILFTSFHVEDDCSNDFVAVYDSLSPDTSQAITEKCGQRPPTNPLQLVSSSNIILVNLITDGLIQRPGFKAQYNVIPLTTARSCGGALTGEKGEFSSPHHPSFYPPALDCKWTIKVAAGKKVRVKFSMFRMKEPQVDQRVCHKDYVEVMGTRYCGEMSSLSLESISNSLDVDFHSDESYTDKGFMAQYTAFDPANPCPGQFVCMSGICISKDLKCDGWNDCGDMSDEMKCKCEEDQFSCANGMCKPQYWVCDRVNDCGDESCDTSEWQCGDGTCVPQDVVCDTLKDCEDGSDEANCKLSSGICSDYSFKCKDKSCINKVNAECDRVTDCSDASDELGCDCGVRPYKLNRIVGGQNAEVGEWPWQVSLHFMTRGPVCGASIISSKWLLSAAHCFRTADPQNHVTSNWRTYSGMQDQLKQAGVLARGLRSIISHPDYNSMTYDYDIALLELSQPLVLSNTIQPICLPASSHVFPSGIPCWVTGWGTLREGAQQTAQLLQKAEVKIINDTVCNVVTEGQRLHGGRSGRLPV